MSPHPRSWHRAAWLTASGALVVWGIVSAVSGWHPFRHTGPVDLDSNVLAVAPIEVLGDRADLNMWSDGVADLLSRSLDGAGPIHTIAPTQVLRHATRPVDRANAMMLARSTGAGLVIYGTMVGLAGDSARLELTLLDAMSRGELASVVVRESRERIDRAVDSTAVQLLRELSRTRAIAVGRLGSLGSQNVAAIRAFLTGEENLRRSRYDSAAAYYRRAVELDSNFALAYRGIYYSAGWLGEGVAANAAGLKAGALNHGLPPRDSLLLAADSLAVGLFHRSDGPMAPMVSRLWQTIELLTDRYPLDAEAWVLLGQERLRFGGPFGSTWAKGLNALDRAIALDPELGPPYLSAVWAALAQQQTDQARRYLDAYVARWTVGPQSEGMRLLRTALLAQPGGSGFEDAARSASSEGLFDALVPLQRWPDVAETGILAARVLVAREGGSSPLVTPTATRTRALAYALAARGHALEAYRTLDVATAAPYAVPFFAELGVMPPDSVVRIFAHWMSAGSVIFRPPVGPVPYVHPEQLLPWLASRGKIDAITMFTERADSVANRGSTARDRATGSYWQVAGRAYGALARRDSAAALRAFETLATRSCPWACGHDRLTHVRLLAAARRFEEAANLLDGEAGTWLLDFAVPVETWWILERARVDERLGHRDTAESAYRYVADMWQHADPELQPVVAECREALARLGRH